jgi:proteasome lid subunit RPN8/RPN11
MVAQAVTELPNECCGLLAGRIVEPESPGQPKLWQVEQRYPLINKAASPTEYFGEEKSLCAANREMIKHGLDLLAVYHSHPTSVAVPSRKDREQNYLGPVVHFIISLQGQTPELRAWWLTQTDATPADWQLIED